MSTAGLYLSGARSRKSCDVVRFSKVTRDLNDKPFCEGLDNVLLVGNFLKLMQASTPN
jgi:hypothetical protein